jgi:hypothetical protein
MTRIGFVTLTGTYCTTGAVMGGVRFAPQRLQ